MLRRFLLWTNEKRWKRRWKRKRKNNSSNGCLMTVLKISLGKPIWFSFPPLPQKRLKKIGPPIFPRKGLCSFNDYVRPQKSDWDSIGPKRNGQKGAGQRMPRFFNPNFFHRMELFLFSDLSYPCSRATFHQIGYLSQLVCLVCEPINLWGRCWLFEIKSVAPCGIQTRVAWVKEVRPSQTDPTRIQIFNRYTSTNITRLLTWKMSQIFIIGCGCCKWKCWYLSLNEGSTLVLLLMWFLSLLCLKLRR